MKHVDRLCLMLTALMVLLTLPAAAAVEAPKQAVGEKTTAMIWFDLDQVSPKMIDSLGAALAGLSDNPMLEQAGGAIPLGELEESIGKIKDFRSRFVNAGGSGLLMTVGMPEEGSWSPTMTMLAKSKGDVDAAAMGKLMAEMSEGAVAESACTALGAGWHNVEMTGPEGQAVTHPLPAKDEAAYKAFSRQLGDGGAPLMRIAFRLQDEMREMAGGAAQGQAADPNMAMMAAMLEPLQALDTIGLSVSQAKADGTFEIDAQMVFLNVEAATNFNAMYQTMLMLAPAMVAQQMAGMPDAPDANEINNFFTKLRMTQDKDALRLKLDSEFFEMVDQLRQKLEKLAEGGGNAIPI